MLSQRALRARRDMRQRHTERPGLSFRASRARSPPTGGQIQNLTVSRPRDPCSARERWSTSEHGSKRNLTDHTDRSRPRRIEAQRCPKSRNKIGSDLLFQSPSALKFPPTLSHGELSDVRQSLSDAQLSRPWGGD